ncbi:hypothetical protein N7481_007375 [Penicillium waksmanii]|uniref:uncharacterized protein n=1 Tax=Penicillium waksmanii TaxID=69791 RepID=UPI002547F0B6|nr:uncharacterized protein N7481_007375 [Penicillium waksmanii]KAJ5980077.1 hypothetical protein N7481_007375 [Penicillium waksmanii]
MINILPRLVTRGDDSNNDGLSTPMVDLLISLLVLVLLALALVAGLLVLRRKRQAMKQSVLPVHNGQVPTHNRGMTITTNRTDSVMVCDEKRSLMDNSSSPPPSPVPEIRITFPEEEDASGKRSSKMVVVRISEHGSYGLEPCNEELPPYQTTDYGRFHSLDIERMGGLKEKEDMKSYS